MIGEDLFKALDRFGIVGLDGDGQRILARLHGRDGGWEANLSSRLREFGFELWLQCLQSCRRYFEPPTVFRGL
jgi:hypothetical protein